jgi:hypothetical protein
MTDKGTTMRISSRNRDALLGVVAEHEDAATLDEALRIVLFEWESYRAMARLATDRAGMAHYQTEARGLGEGNVTVHDEPYDWGADAKATAQPRRR